MNGKNVLDHDELVSNQDPVHLYELQEQAAWGKRSAECWSLQVEDRLRRATGEPPGGWKHFVPYLR